MRSTRRAQPRNASTRGGSTASRRFRGKTATLQTLKDFSHHKNNVWGITARNREQNFALNLLMHPEVGVQIRGERFAARDRTASPDERPALWAIMTTLYPRNAGMQQSTEREIPVVILERR